MCMTVDVPNWASSIARHARRHQLPPATGHNSKMILGQLWHFKADRYWHSDTAGGYMKSATNATRYSDGQQLTADSKKRCIEVIQERIVDGTY